MPSGVVIKIVGLADGAPHEFAGKYVVNYDPSPDGVPLGECVLVVDEDVQRAKRYPDAFAAGNEWKRVDTRQPIRADGRPNRPLTAFSVEIVKAP